MNDDTTTDHVDSARAFVRNVAEQEVAENGWDQQPSIALVFEHPLGNSPDDGVVIEAIPLPVGDLWNIVHDVALMLRAAAAAVRMSIGTHLPFHPWPISANFIGALLICESTTVSGETDDVERFEQIKAWIMAGNALADHPDAYDAKTVMLLEVDGVLTSTSLRRDTGEHATNTTSLDDEEPHPLAHALAHLVMAGGDRHDEERNT